MKKLIIAFGISLVAVPTMAAEMVDVKIISQRHLKALAQQYHSHQPEMNSSYHRQHVQNNSSSRSHNVSNIDFTGVQDCVLKYQLADIEMKAVSDQEALQLCRQELKNTQAEYKSLFENKGEKDADADDRLNQLVKKGDEIIAALGLAGVKFKN